MADFVRWTGIPLAWSELLWQAISLFVILLACASIARQLFQTRERTGGRGDGSAMFTCRWRDGVDGGRPVSASAKSGYRSDSYRCRDDSGRQAVLAVPLLLLAFLVHPSWRVWYLFLLDSEHCLSGGCMSGSKVGGCAEPRRARRQRRHRLVGSSRLPPQAGGGVEFKKYFHLYRWTWYEWLGAIAPIFLFWLLWRFAEKRGERRMARFALAVLIYGVFQQAVALIVASTPALVRLTPMQPMRFLI